MFGRDNIKRNSSFSSLLKKWYNKLYVNKLKNYEI